MSEMILPLALFTIANAMTPGPNNIMLTASGAAFGFRRTLPHIAGIVIGFPAMTLAVGWGLGELFALYPHAHTILKWLGAAYLLYLAARMAAASAPKDAENAGQPLTALEAALFQWVNPKAWTMVVSAIPAFTTLGPGYDAQLVTMALVFMAVSLPSASIWCAFGVGIRRLVSDPATLRLVNIVLSGLLALSVLLLFV
jgi:Putative threonine efflux protein